MQYSFDSMQVVKHCEFGLKMPTDAPHLIKVSRNSRIPRRH